jgi:hypothetical protein
MEKAHPPGWAIPGGRGTADGTAAIARKFMASDHLRRKLRRHVVNVGLPSILTENTKFLADFYPGNEDCSSYKQFARRIDRETRETPLHCGYGFLIVTPMPISRGLPDPTQRSARDSP